MYDNYYFLGIGGIGMSAIARYFKHNGRNVSGYDRTRSPLTAKLEQEGIEVHYEDRPDLIPFDIDNTFVIYTPAIPEDLEEFKYVREKGYAICKRSKALGQITAGKDCLAVAGTHGKTTTSTLLAHILTTDEKGCSAFLGGISKNYHTNLLLSHSDDIVVEADEFDRSFHQLHPQIAVITAIDADHLDIYGDYQSVMDSFEQFASQIVEGGTLILKNGVPMPTDRVKARVYRYSFDTPCDFYASDIKHLPFGRFDFTLNYPGGKIEHCTVGIPGWVNVENAVAASAAALSHGVSVRIIKTALASFQGVERRIDIHFSSDKHAYVDDYAHHPNEIRAAISSIRDIFPGRKILGIFQPHLYTRTRDFADDFAAALSGLDSLIMLPIYPAREEPIEGVNSEMILDKVTIDDKMIVPKEELMKTVAAKDVDVLVTFGAGDIDRFVKQFEEYMSNV
ncbi:MAG: UDP-N-acetylmuramate--L-alanine ligase [Bacteroidales bacterium]|nr:UDP-N-acetylmuramate--L-alanine ligase [Bacteroidales bacterium]